MFEKIINCVILMVRYYLRVWEKNDVLEIRRKGIMHTEFSIVKLIVITFTETQSLSRGTKNKNEIIN
jgi:predicted transcriptional regulator